MYWRTPHSARSILTVAFLLGVAGNVNAQGGTTEAQRYQRFKTNLQEVVSREKDNDLAKQVLQRLQDGPADTDISKADEYLTKIAGMLLAISKALPGLAGRVVTGAGTLLVPQRTAVEISDALNFARKIATSERQAVVTWTMWVLPTEGFVKMLDGNPQYANRILLVLAGQI